MIDDNNPFTFSKGETNTETVKKAYSYVRFSSAEQAKGDSLRRQLELSREYAKANKLELDASLKLTDLGISAFRGKNRVKGSLAGFYRAIEKGAVTPGSVLLVESLDRLSRDEISEAVTSFMQIINAGITLITLSDGMVYNRKTINTNMGSLMMSIVIMSRAHEESATKSKRIVASWENKRASIGTKKMTALCPEWLKLSEDRTQFIEIPERVAIVKRFFDLHTSGYGKRRIAQILNGERVSTWGRGKRKSTAWHSSYIDKILQSRAVLGEYQPHRMEEGKRVPVGDPIRDYFPSVIPLSLWQRVNSERVRTGGRTSNAVRNLFAGLAFEGGTDIKMLYIDKGQHNTSTRYLQSDRRRIEPDAVVRLWNYDETEAAFLRVMYDLDWSGILGHRKSDEGSVLIEKIAMQEQSRIEYKRKIERLTQAIASSSQEIQPLVKALEEVARESDNIESEIKKNKATLRQMEAEHEHFGQNIGEFRQLIKDAADSTDLDLRLRLREEIRSKIKRIEFRHSGWPRWQQTQNPWLNPNIMLILFQNGAARVVLLQSGKRGEPLQIKMVNAAAYEDDSSKLKSRRGDRNRLSI